MPTAGWRHSNRLRDILFLALLTAAVFLFGNFAVVRTVMQPRMHVIGIGMAAEIGAIHDACLRLPPSERLPWVERLVAASGGGLALRFPGPGTLRSPLNTTQAEGMQLLQRQLPGMSIGFSDGDDDPRVWFAVPAAEGELLWLTIPVAPVAERTRMLMAVWGSGGVLVVLFGVLAIGWLQQRRVRGTVRALAQIGGPALPAAAFAGAPAVNAPPDDLSGVRSLEELVRVMSARMESVDTLRDDAMAVVAREVRAVLAHAPPEAAQAPCLAAFERLAGQFEAFAQVQALAAEPVQPVDLDALVVRKTLQAPAGVALGLAPVPPLLLRPRAMECLLDNLLRNALSHGGGQVMLTSAQDGGWVVLRVLDRGESLADDELAMVGRPFYRSEAARAHGIAAGLGLALARHIAQLHGGQLQVQRREGGGTAVEVRLPVPQDETAMRQPPASPRRRPAWVSLLGDMALLSFLYVGAFVLGLSMLARTVMEPNLEASSRILDRILGGIAGAYVSLPAEARTTYLQDLSKHSGGAVHEDDPARFLIAEPLMSGVRTVLDWLRHSRPEVELATSPMPDAALWVRLPPVDGATARPWLMMNARQYSRDLAVVLVGLALVVSASAGFLAVRARRRLDWAAEALRADDAALQAQALAHGENPAMVRGLMHARQGFLQACGRVAQARDEQAALLERLAQDLRASIAGLRQRHKQSPGLAEYADMLQLALAGLEALAQPAQRSARRVVHVNEALSAMQVDPRVSVGRPVRWSLGGVPCASLGGDDARRLFRAVFHFLQAQEAGILEVSSTLENGWVVARFTELGGSTDPGAAAQALASAGQAAESHGGFMRFGRAPDGCGAQVEILLPPAGGA